MKQTLHEELRQYFANIDTLHQEIKTMEDAIETLNFNQEILDDILFWNHYLSLVERVYNHAQNDLEFEDTGEIPQECIDVSKELFKTHKLLKDYDITDFETYLFAIYFAKNRKEVDK
ncbi:hypothetical protein AOC36_07580 [Erysipelothrix larvae]|uniref:PRD domain-containing protein n=1 Tax=Erysipelothrix larvae TaxID=1514105 RepID=A0A0X8H0I7_9FIRM|nr:hypothetical protein [Erysipelothrix larvae]AMC93849.1 hypothetical protein AOC36_07580 [Erysipelothrix larvae]